MDAIKPDPRRPQVKHPEDALPAVDPGGNRNSETIAYFSMEIGLEESIPTYSGGLGMLTGDTIRSAADPELPMVAVSLIHRRGYFRQRLAADGTQAEEPFTWSPADRLQELPARASVQIEKREVKIRAWRYEVRGISNRVVPVYLLDTDLEENLDGDRRLTDHLYGGDARYRLCQEVILGIGGVRMLRALGYRNIRRFHMNEGHASLLTVELAYEFAVKAGTHDLSPAVVAQVKPLCVFTTHTPVAAGHDKFPLSLLARVVTCYGRDFDQRAIDFCLNGELNTTYLALDNSRFINGVAKKHGEVSRHMFTQYKIDSITNGVPRSPGRRRPCASCSTATFPAGASTTPACATRWASRSWKSGMRIAAPSRRCWPTSTSRPAQAWIAIPSPSASRAGPLPTSAPTCCSGTWSSSWRFRTRAWSSR